MLTKARRPGLRALGAHDVHTDPAKVDQSIRTFFLFGNPTTDFSAACTAKRYWTSAEPSSPATMNECLFS